MAKRSPQQTGSPSPQPPPTTTTPLTPGFKLVFFTVVGLTILSLVLKQAKPLERIVGSSCCQLTYGRIKPIQSGRFK